MIDKRTVHQIVEEWLEDKEYFLVEVSVTSEKLGEKPVEKVEITVVKPVEQVEKPVEVPETSEKKAKPVETVKAVKRRGRPRKVKAE